MQDEIDMLINDLIAEVKKRSTFKIYAIIAQEWLESNKELIKKWLIRNKSTIAKIVK